MTRLKLIKNKDPEKLTQEVDEFMSKNKVVASPILYAKNLFNCFIYYEESKFLENEKKPYSKKPFIGQIKNPNDPATEGQIRKLRAIGYKDSTDNLTKGKASVIINILEKER